MASKTWKQLAKTNHERTDHFKGVYNFTRIIMISPNQKLHIFVRQINIFPDIEQFDGSITKACQVFAKTELLGALSTSLGGTVDALHATGHHGAATERDNEHEEPVGDETHSPHEVAEGNSYAVLGKLAVEGMEPAAVNAVELVLATGLVEGNQSVRGCGSQVKPLAVNLDGRRFGEHLNDIEAGGTRRPGIAENGLVVAIQVGHMGGVVEERKLGSGLVEGLLDSSASTVAGLVAARDEQPPLLRSSSTS